MPCWCLCCFFSTCSQDKVSDTAIIAEIISDLVVPGENNQLYLKAKDPQANTIYDQTFDLGEGTKAGEQTHKNSESSAGDARAVAEKAFSKRQAM